MPNDLKGLRANLAKSPFARARFLADTLSLLKSNGVDVDDVSVMKELDLDMDLNNGERFVDGLVASTNIITIVN